MRTDDLITAMTADNVPRPQVGALIMRWFLPALAIVGLTALALLGPRVDLAAAMSAPVTAMKPILPLILAVAAGWAVVRRANPAERAGWLIWPMSLIAGVAALWLIATLASVPAPQWWPAAKGQSLWFCLIAVPVIAALPLMTLIAVLRNGASTAPMRSGALAGLAAGAGAAAIYALHCTEDSPLFFLCWYSVGIIAVTGIGALAGRRWLRW